LRDIAAANPVIGDGQAINGRDRIGVLSKFALKRANRKPKTAELEITLPLLIGRVWVPPARVFRSMTRGLTDRLALRTLQQ
jgi:hypothetical protein